MGRRRSSLPTVTEVMIHLSLPVLRFLSPYISLSLSLCISLSIAVEARLTRLASDRVSQ